VLILAKKIAKKVIFSKEFFGEKIRSQRVKQIIFSRIVKFVVFPFCMNFSTNKRDKKLITPNVFLRTFFYKCLLKLVIHPEDKLNAENRE
jgi:hypothetical protein